MESYFIGEEPAVLEAGVTSLCDITCQLFFILEYMKMN